MMNAIVVALGVVISATCSHAIGEKIYLVDGLNYYPLSTSNAAIGGPTRIPEAGSLVISVQEFRTLLQQFIANRKNNNMVPSAHRSLTSTVDITSPFQNDGRSSAFYRNQDNNLQNHPGGQQTQESLGTQGFANEADPFSDRLYNNPMVQVNAVPAPQVNAVPAPQVNAAPVDYMSAFTNSGTSSAYFKNQDQNAHNFPIKPPTQNQLGSQGFVNPEDPFTGKLYV